MTHDRIPVVTQPRSVVEAFCTVRGLATRMMDGWLICMEHCAPLVYGPLVQASE